MTLQLNALSTTSTAANDGANEDKFPFKKLSLMWQNYHRDNLKLRHFTGSWLNDRHGPPTRRQAYGKATLQQYIEKLGVAESDLSRMRWFAFYFKSVEELKEKEPTVTTWTKVKDVIARLRHPKADPAVKLQSDEKKLVVVERPVDRMIEAVRAVQSLGKVGKLTLNDGDRMTLKEAVEAMLRDVGACLGGHFTFTNSVLPDQPVASLATTDLVEHARMRQFESASVELPAAVL